MELINHSFGFYGVTFFGIILIRYFLVAGGTYWLFYSNLYQSLSSPNLLLQHPSWESIQRDIKLSTMSSVVFAIASAIILSAYNHHLTHLYSDPQQYGLGYLGISYLAVLVLQDA